MTLERSEPPLEHAWADDLAEGVVAIAGGRVVWMNRAAAALLRVDPLRARGLPLIAVLRDHRLERAYLEGDAMVLETRGRYLEARPYRDGLLLRDVTDEQRTREDARELLAVLSHELRTPVTTIRSTLEALRFELPEATRERFLDNAQREVERLTRLLEDLTVEARPPAARSVPLLEVIDRARAILDETLRARGTDVRVEMDARTVWADPDKLLQVVLNLLENAAVHGPADATVRLRGEPEPDGRWFRLEVRDEGAPLDPELAERLFKPHSRGRGASAGGSGLGLYIVRSIVERWGGVAGFEASPEGGSGGGNAFVVTVPLCAPQRRRRT